MRCTALHTQDLWEDYVRDNWEPVLEQTFGPDWRTQCPEEVSAMMWCALQPRGRGPEAAGAAAAPAPGTTPARPVGSAAERLSVIPFQDSCVAGTAAAAAASSPLAATHALLLPLGTSASTEGTQVAQLVLRTPWAHRLLCMAVGESVPLLTMAAPLAGTPTASVGAAGVAPAAATLATQQQAAALAVLGVSGNGGNPKAGTGEPEPPELLQQLQLELESRLRTADTTLAAEPTAAGSGASTASSPAGATARAAAGGVLSSSNAAGTTSRTLPVLDLSRPSPPSGRLAQAAPSNEPVPAKAGEAPAVAFAAAGSTAAPPGASLIGAMLPMPAAQAQAGAAVVASGEAGGASVWSNAVDGGSLSMHPACLVLDLSFPMQNLGRPADAGGSQAGAGAANALCGAASQAGGGTTSQVPITFSLALPDGTMLPVQLLPLQLGAAGSASALGMQGLLPAAHAAERDEPALGVSGVAPLGASFHAAVSSVERPDAEGRMPLHVAAAAGRSDIVEQLLLLGCDPGKPLQEDWLQQQPAGVTRCVSASLHLPPPPRRRCFRRSCGCWHAMQHNAMQWELSAFARQQYMWQQVRGGDVAIVFGFLCVCGGGGRLCVQMADVVQSACECTFLLGRV